LRSFHYDRARSELAGVARIPKGFTYLQAAGFCVCRIRITTDVRAKERANLLLKPASLANMLYGIGSPKRDWPFQLHFLDFVVAVLARFGIWLVMPDLTSKSRQQSKQTE
jgi:hypothetical protein